MPKAKHEMKDLGYVYLLHCVGTPYYKIGKTKNDPEGRAASVRRMNPLEITELGLRYTGQMSALEKYCHLQLHDRHHRYEWFTFESPEEAVSLFNEKVNSFKRYIGENEVNLEEDRVERVREALESAFAQYLNY